MERLQRELFEAAASGSVSSLRQLLIDDPLLLDRVTPNYNSETALHVSALLGHLGFVKQIIGIKPELTNKLNSQRSSPLHLASAKGHVDVVRELLSVVSHEATCLAQDKDGLTPLHLAAVEGQVAVMELLLQAKPEAARLTLYGGETILHLCVKNWQVEALNLLVSSVSDPEFVKCKDGEGNTLLHLAVEYKQLEDYYATMGGQFRMSPPSAESRKSSVGGGSTSDKEATPPLKPQGFQFPPYSTQIGLGDFNLEENIVDDDVIISKAKVIWTKEEEIRLAQAWSTISCSSEVGNAQKNKEFWQKTTAYFNEHRPVGTPQRAPNVIKAHYYQVIPDINTFSGWYNNFYSNRASGQSDDDVLAATEAKWSSVHPKKNFKYMHMWRIMKELDKWAPQQTEYHAYKKSRTSESGEHNSSNQDTDVEMPRSRPMGQQRAKKLAKAKDKGKGKVKGKTQVEEDEITNEMWEKMQEFQLNKMKLQEEKMKQKAIEIQQRDFEFLLKDTREMTEDQRQLHEQIVAKIKERHGLN